MSVKRAITLYWFSGTFSGPLYWEHSLALISGLPKEASSGSPDMAYSSSKNYCTLETAEFCLLPVFTYTAVLRQPHSWLCHCMCLSPWLQTISTWEHSQQSSKSCKSHSAFPEAKKFLSWSGRILPLLLWLHEVVPGPNSSDCSAAFIQFPT